MSLTTPANIDNILPLVCTSSDAYSLMDMAPRIFKDPSLLGAYHGAPPLIHPSAQVCVVSSNGTDIGDTIPPTEASPHLDVPPIEEILPRDSLRTLLHHLSLISPSPGENPGLGDNPPSHHSNSLLLPPIESTIISGSRDAYPSQHGALHPCMVSTPTRDGSSTIPPSSIRGNPDAYSSTNSDHTTLTPNFQHHRYGWGKMEEERSHSSTSSLSSTSLRTMKKRGTPH
jgi:hypothetical protein